jgi:ABC-type polar amino acid transport system ATPase subunit
MILAARLQSSSLTSPTSSLLFLLLQVGMVFQSYALFNHMTVLENIKFGLQVCGMGVLSSSPAIVTLLHLRSPTMSGVLFRK